ncbi:hypothetical protein FRC00_001338 [Tulasnella sp. 408]|nr:hypothetical protein FRC00_001338 [Tulasnella sp. 408]
MFRIAQSQSQIIQPAFKSKGGDLGAGPEVRSLVLLGKAKRRSCRPDIGPAAHAAVSERIKNLTVMVDDRLQEEGAALFNQFHERVRQADEQLLTFGNAIGPLGSLVGLISSSSNLRARPQQILHLFRENASEAFPDKIQKEPAEPLQKASQTPSSGTPATSDLEKFPAEFEDLARDLATFLHFLHDIPELRDESLNASVLSLEF